MTAEDFLTAAEIEMIEADPVLSIQDVVDFRTQDGHPDDEHDEEVVA